ncbi:MAG: (deoxy)nucleoside triphosphate pyrophosphohydrolase [Anaeromicrobium sp.]|jgi:8-oxo-dGTP diphosphatase|uniref:(deoxy)nucleoside triphosphate pyrophosphohydrolase n=1 Tax=Anaeromicrobium sp. TaxID=1929132 RepID=UPI0025DAEC55|nr:(deoxy)nucleoside triphosphate pyrophosphohydrolase [Anaeromicrobium sp.]MCT4592983.1 (deoxy)nucleoside triphosphate pyrophosphohydrolase [Anaeromicrobium sp.]
MIEVVAAIIRNDKNEILIAKRKESKSLGGFWEFPGGKIEKGESDEESLIRELKEEMDIDIEVKNYFDENIYDYADKIIKLKAYEAVIKKGNINLKDHSQFVWCKPCELDKYKIAPADIKFVEEIKND